MNIPLQSLHVKRFKNIEDASFDASNINVLIGANNSGKSTLAQSIHFAISIFQSIELINRWGTQNQVSLSLNPDQLIYSPCRDLYALGYGQRLRENEATEIEIRFILENGEEISLAIRKGRIINIFVTVENVPEAKKLSSLERPYTIYSPGLAGIARHENYISDGVLLRTIARGDANLVFRNILLRLSSQENNNPWRDFHGDLNELFPDISIKVEYKQETDEFVDVFVESGRKSIPIEIAGTGILQAVQILAYVHFFHPSVIILDEPDSHLHPNNQRLLCSLLQAVAEERDTQVFLTTHSRHVVDALSGQANFLWVRNSEVETIKQDHDLAILLDIGALDVKEMLTNSDALCIVLTEDSRKRGLTTLLEASSFPMEDTLVLSYHGCTSPHNLRPLLELIRSSNRHAAIVVHRDLDYLTEDECENWKTEIRNMRAKPFLTGGVDIESHFLVAGHLSQINGITAEEAQRLLDDATDNTSDISIEKIVNGRSDIEKKAGTFGQLNLGRLAIQARSLYEADKVRYRHSKSVIRELRRLYKQRTDQNLSIIEISNIIANESLREIARRLPH